MSLLASDLHEAVADSQFLAWSQGSREEHQHQPQSGAQQRQHTLNLHFAPYDILQTSPPTASFSAGCKLS